MQSTGLNCLGEKSELILSWSRNVEPPAVSMIRQTRRLPLERKSLA